MSGTAVDWDALQVLTDRDTGDESGPVPQADGDSSSPPVIDLMQGLKDSLARRRSREVQA